MYITAHNRQANAYMQPWNFLLSLFICFVSVLSSSNSSRLLLFCFYCSLLFSHFFVFVSATFFRLSSFVLFFSLFWPASPTSVAGRRNRSTCIPFFTWSMGDRLMIITSMMNLMLFPHRRRLFSYLHAHLKLFICHFFFSLFKRVTFRPAVSITLLFDDEHLRSGSHDDQSRVIKPTASASTQTVGRWFQRRPSVFELSEFQQRRRWRRQREWRRWRRR